MFDFRMFVRNWNQGSVLSLGNALVEISSSILEMNSSSGQVPSQSGLLLERTETFPSSISRCPRMII